MGYEHGWNIRMLHLQCMLTIFLCVHLSALISFHFAQSHQYPDILLLKTSTDKSGVSLKLFSRNLAL